MKNVTLFAFFDLLKNKVKQWEETDLLNNTIQIGKEIIPQMEKYLDGKYRSDRNEFIGFFEAMDKFSQANLSLTVDHFISLIDNYQRRLLPYPHNTDISVDIPDNF